MQNKKYSRISLVSGTLNDEVWDSNLYYLGTIKDVEEDEEEDDDDDLESDSPHLCAAQTLDALVNWYFLVLLY